MNFFLAGIMQGSHEAATLHNQHYRTRLADALRRHWPAARVYDPLADHGQSLSYDDRLGRDVFFRHNQMCREVDVVIAFVPEASMGTAIEMWEAFRHGRVVLAISPLVHNWTVKYCSHALFPDLDAFEGALEAGQVAERIKEVLSTEKAARDEPLALPGLAAGS
jgi:hypothetical protein